MGLDHQRQLAMQIGKMTKKLEALTRRVDDIERQRNSSKSSGVSKVSTNGTRQSQKSDAA